MRNIKNLLEIIQIHFQLILIYQKLVFVIKDILPSDELYVEFRVLKECGDILTTDGQIIKLKKGSMHYLKRSDVNLMM